MQISKGYLVGVFAHVLLFVTINSTIGQKISSPDTSARKEIFSKCVRAIETENPDSIKKYFHELRKYSIPSSGDTSFKHLPGLYYKAGKIMAAKNYKKETVEFYYESALLYRTYYGEGNSVSPIALVKIANYLDETKEHENAISYYQSAIKDGLEYTGDHWLYCMNQIGNCYSEIEEYEIARGYYQQIHNKYSTPSIKDSVTIGKNYLNTATTYEAEGKHSEALSYLSRALSCYNIDNTQHQINVAFLFNNIGNVYLDMADYSNAKVYYLKSLRIRKGIFKTNSVELSQSYYNVGYCHYNHGDVDIALQYSDSSIAANIVDYKKSLEIKQYPKVECISKQDLLICLLDKAEYLIMKSQVIDKRSCTNGKLIETLKAAEEIFYSYYSEISSYRSKIIWSKYNDRLYKLYVQLYGWITDPKLSQEVISYGDLKRNFNHRNFEALNYSESKETEFLNSVITSEINSGFDSVFLSSTHPSSLKRVLFSDTILYPLIKTKLGKHGIAKIQNKLHPLTSIVSYSLSDSNLFIQVISYDSIIVLPKIVCGLKEKVSDHINRIKTYSNYENTGEYLYEVLWQDLKPYLTGKQDVIIIPDEYLFNLPFETLTDPFENSLLVENIDVSYAFSLNALLKDNKNIKDRTNYYGFSPVGKKSYEFNPTIKMLEKSFLKMADNEINACAAIFSNNGHNSIKFFSAYASIANLQTIKDPFGICHISSHGIIDPSNPWRSYLQMYPDTIFHSGKLQIPIIYSLNIEAQIIIMNACETGFGESNTIEGSLSLGRAFSANRINHLILSLWKIEDQVSYELIEDFLSNYTTSEDISVSINKTKRAFLNSPLNHAFFWAGHVHYNNSL